ncbi:MULTISPECIES: hypothetical protein [Burkholderia]|uniref:hypothetical protein n=1 Tax=Burkholderia TaxID=32008 RepID=UPI000B0175D7|nr:MULTISPECIES: hypothetical protein [Burkholderia]
MDGERSPYKTGRRRATGSSGSDAGSLRIGSPAGTLKNEPGRPQRFATREQARQSIDESIEPLQPATFAGEPRLPVDGRIRTSAFT